tara:strand:+ start:272 stop:994 length:723 start_codon:yes stop_codon:yes gene_type:complete
MKENSLFHSIKTIILAIFIALIIRSFFTEPFNIPSGSMKPTLLVGDFLFVKKWSYGYSKHSLPFSLPIIKNRIFYKEPSRGDIVVFKTPEDNRTDYIKRVIGVPKDKIEIKNGIIFLNDSPVSQIQINNFEEIDLFGNKIQIDQYKEILLDKEYNTIDLNKFGIADNTNIYIVPDSHFFVMGDNRDNSQDSRFSTPGFIPKENLVGQAWFVFFSLENSRFYQIWKWPKSIRYSKILTKIS